MRAFDDGDGDDVEDSDFSRPVLRSKVRFGFDLAVCFGAGVGVSTSEIGAGNRSTVIDNSRITSKSRSRMLNFTSNENKLSHRWR